MSGHSHYCGIHPDKKEKALYHKLKRVLITPQGLAMILTQSKQAFIVEHGLPVGTEVRGLTIDPTTNCIVLFVEHESFDAIPEHTIVPDFDNLHIIKA